MSRKTTVSRLRPGNYGANIEAAQLSGDKDRVEAILTELWEEYGIDPEKDPDQRATGGIRKLVVTDDHFAHRG
jgi:hypothetical protein